MENGVYCKILTYPLTGLCFPLASAGLREIIECTAVKRGTFYICKICKTIIHKKRIIHHVVGLWHRANYIVSLFSSCVSL